MLVTINNKNHAKMISIAGDMPDLPWMHMDLTSYEKIIITISFYKPKCLKHA